MFSIIDRHNQLTKHNQYADNIGVLAYIDELKGFILDGSYLAATFICQPLTGGGHEVMNSLDDLYQKDYPADAIQQVSLFASPYIKPTLDNFEDIREDRIDGELANLYNSLSRDSYNYLKECTVNPIHKQSGLMVRDFEVWFTLKIPLKKQKPSKSEIREFTILSAKLKNTLSTIGMSPIEMNAESYVHRMQMLHNHSPDAMWRNGEGCIDAGLPIRNQILEKNNRVIVEKDGLQIGDPDGDDGCYIKSLSVQKTPDIIQFGDMLDMYTDWRKGRNGIYTPFLMTLNIHFPDQEKAQSQFTKDRSWITNQATGALVKFVDKLRYQKRDYDEFFKSIFTKGAKIANCYLQITAFAPTKRECEQAVRDIQSFTALKNYKFLEDRYLSLPLFLSTLPMGADKSSIQHFHRYNRVTTDILKFFSPLLANWKGNAFFSPVMPLVTRAGQLFSLDPFTTDGNMNVTVCASSGSGKSYFINAYVSNFLTTGSIRGGELFRDKPLSQQYKPLDGGRVFIIDVGYSYKPLCEMYKGKYIDVGEHLEFSLNPFRAIHEFSGTDGQGVMLLQLLKFMASPSDELTDFQVARMLSILGDLWEDKGQEAKIDDFADLCKEDEDIRVRDIGFMLEPWCSNGIYGAYFNDSYPPLDFSGNFVVVELELLKDKPELQLAVLMQAMSCIQHEMYLSSLDIKKMFILDEGWSFIADPENGGESEAVGLFLEKGWRRFRKTRSSGTLITQGLNDYFSSRVGRAIYDNSSFKIFLRQDKDALAKVVKDGKYDGSDTDIALLKSLHTVKGQYSEAYIQHEEAKEVVRLFVPRFQQYLYSTDAADKTLIRNKMAQHNVDYADAITLIIEDEKAGLIKERADLTDDEIDGLFEGDYD